MTDRYAVIGNPIAHSRSPDIHAQFAQEVGHDISYERLLAPLNGFAPTVLGFIAQGGRGANVTLPFKLEAFALATDLSARAQLAGAVNTLKFDENRIFGDNTDGVGLYRDLQQNLNIELSKSRILILGAGGAAHGAIGPLLDSKPRRMVIANRTSSRGAELATHFASTGEIEAVALDALAGEQFDVVINATSASLTAEMPAVPATCFARGALAYDMMYGKGLTPFLALAAKSGARTSDGLGMLIEQAADAFYIWRGIRPATAPVISRMRAA
jgi:shikimate dehydrogenase